VAWSPDGNQIASGSDDKTIKIWDSQSGDCQSTLTGHRYVIPPPLPVTTVLSPTVLIMRVGAHILVTYSVTYLVVTVVNGQCPTDEKSDPIPFTLLGLNDHYNGRSTVTPYRSLYSVLTVTVTVGVTLRLLVAVLLVPNGHSNGQKKVTYTSYCSRRFTLFYVDICAR